MSLFAEKLKKIFSFGKTFDENFFDDMIDAMIEGEVSSRDAIEIIETLKSVCKKNKIENENELRLALKEIVVPFVKNYSLEIQNDKTNIWMVLGVNGGGKTTTLAKLANLYKSRGTQNIVFACADTFRAAASEQLISHAEKLGIRAIHHEAGSDPAAVVFDAGDAVRAKGGGLVLADTAGRLHNNEGLLRELSKIDRMCEKKSDENCYKKILIIDSTTGQNALRQLEVFNQAVPVDCVIMTKHDSSAKGGIAISLGKQFHIPIAFVCNGEHYENISAFNPEKYVNEFLGL